MTASSTHRNKSKKKKVLLFVAIIVFIAAIVIILELTHVFKRSDNANSSTHSTNIATSNDTKSSNLGSANKGQIETSTSNQSSSTGVAPSTPIGDFVSDHHPNLSDSPAPNTMTSVCSSTPGAQCIISFTMGNTVKSLSPETVDQDGSAYWSWTLQSEGLTSGTWKITATATLNGQSASAQDATDLVVSQ